MTAKDRIAPDLFCAYKTSVNIFTTMKSDAFPTNRTANNYQIPATCSCPGQQNANKVSSILVIDENMINASTV